MEVVEIASTNQVPNAMMEIYAASKKLAPRELDIPEKSDKANKPQPATTNMRRALPAGMPRRARPPAGWWRDLSQGGARWEEGGGWCLAFLPVADIGLG
jgi:hypothetical protein